MLICTLMGDLFSGLVGRVVCVLMFTLTGNLLLGLLARVFGVY